MSRKNIRFMTAGSLLLALSLMIPMLFGGTLSLAIGPFTATPASHVPTFLSILFGPTVAGIVALGSAIGFFLKLGPIVGLRAAMHIPVGISGALLLKKKIPFPYVLAILAPLHGALEALLVLFFGFSPKDAGYLVGVGTLVHHAVDSLIAVVCWGILDGTGLLKTYLGVKQRKPATKTR